MEAPRWRSSAEKKLSVSFEIVRLMVEWIIQHRWVDRFLDVSEKVTVDRGHSLSVIHFW